MNNLPRLAELVKARNTVESNIANLIGQSVNMGSVGDYIAFVTFGITPEKSETQKAIYDRFSYGPLTGHSVDVQWHTRHEGDLSLRMDPPPDYYLVLSGPKVGANTIHSLVHPWVIESVYLFDARELLTALRERGVQIGNRTSIIGQLWERAEIFPVQRNNRLVLSEEQRKLLYLFG
jgi:hypothetical protein